MLMMLRIAMLICIVLIGLMLVGCGQPSRNLSDEQWLTLQSDLQQERSEIGHQRDLLETDRREWDSREHSDHLFAAAISSATLLFCCALPLVLVAVLLWPRKSEPDEVVVSDLLINDVIPHVHRSAIEAKRLEQPTTTGNSANDVTHESV